MAFLRVGTEGEMGRGYCLARLIRESALRYVYGLDQWTTADITIIECWDMNNGHRFPGGMICCTGHGTLI